MFTIFYIQVSSTFTILGLIAESTLKGINNTRSKIFGSTISEKKLLPNLVLFLNTICILQQAKISSTLNFKETTLKVEKKLLVLVLP